MTTAFVDVDTQLDFVYPAGALYVPGAEHIVPTVARLNRYAAAHGIPVISTTDAHYENDAEFRTWPPHCVAGTWGQHKPESTVLPKDNRQIIVEKQTVDAFESPNMHRALKDIGAESYVVYGVVTEVCVQHAVRGLIKAGASVTIVTDAIQALSREAGARALEEMRAAGAKLVQAAEILS